MAQHSQNKGNEWQYLVTVSLSQQRENPISCVKFDPFEELLWCATSTGRVTSFAGANQYNRFSAFRSSLTGPVHALEVTEETVFSLSNTCLRANTRHGVNVASYSSGSMTNMRSLYRVPNSSTFVLGGQQDKLLLYDFSKQKEMRTALIKENGAAIIRSNGGNLFTADVAGSITMRNAKTLETLQTISVHGERVCDFDVQGSKLITCGCSQRLEPNFRMKNIHGDPFIKIYDLRTLKALPPIPIGFAPIFSRFMPSYCEKIVLVSQTGTVRISDLNSGGIGTQFLVETPCVSAFDFSSSKQMIAIGDYSGTLHVQCDRDGPVINESSWETVFADPVQVVQQAINFDDVATPLATVPLPFPEDENLFSDWPSDNCQPIYRRMKPPRQYTDVKNMHFVQQVKNPLAGTKLRYCNIVPYMLDYEEPKVSEVKIDTSPAVVPQIYRKLGPQPARKQFEEDTSSVLTYNKTKHVPIESTPHSLFVNPIAQMLYHVPTLRNVFYSHLCFEDNCIACQLRFLFTMLTDRTPLLPEPASSMNLTRSIAASGAHLNEDALRSTQLALSHIVNAARKATEESEEPSQLSDAEKTILKSDLNVNSRCVRCSLVNTKEASSYAVTVNYNLMQGSRQPSFCQMVEKALHVGGQTEGECTECKTRTQMEENRRVKKLSSVLLIDTNATSDKFFDFWQQQLAIHERRPKYKKPENECVLGERSKAEKKCRFGTDCRNRPNCKFTHGKVDWDSECSSWLSEGGGEWKHFLPSKLHAEVAHGGIVRLTDVSNELSSPVTTRQGDVYQLVSMVAVVGSGKKLADWTHTVAMVRDSDEIERPWTVINEILVTRVHDDEALHCDARWRLPLVLAYVKMEQDFMNVPEKRLRIPESVFQTDSNLTGNEEVARERRQMKLPEKGDLLGIDAEFIKICQKSERQKKNFAWRAAARVSCVDATGQIVLIDDYVITDEKDTVEDYLTKFSGIQEDDLDPQKSTKHLTTLKRVYLKILCLIERGVIFVGHALVNDFSVLNIYVPPSQIIDTVVLFRLPSQRFLSLQFLAFHLLGHKIQEDGHDSVEDAKYALMIYRRHEELTKEGCLDSEIRRFYEITKNSGATASPIVNISPADNRSVENSQNS